MTKLNNNDFRDGLKVEELKLNDIQKQQIYQKSIVEPQEPGFIEYMNFLNSILCILKQYGIVSDYTRFMGRIKSLESAIKNDEKKVLNDVFGLEICNSRRNRFFINSYSGRIKPNEKCYT